MYSEYKNLQPCDRGRSARHVDWMPMSEQEFPGDARGLTPPKTVDGKEVSDDAAAATAEKMYMKMLFGAVPLAQMVLGAVTYLALNTFGTMDTLNAKFSFMNTWDLGYPLLAIYIVGLGRQRIMVNANAARAGARVDRPDQHVYKIMDKHKVLGQSPDKMPFVLMANTGWQGKFNRAQRGGFNTDEAMPQVLMNTAIGGAIFGPIIVPCAMVAVFGRVKFALGYTDASSKRGAGLGAAFLGEAWIGGLVLFAAVKAIAGDRFPM